MIALVQGSGGIALVMAFALLGTRLISAAGILLGVQSVVVAIAAVGLHRPLLALPPAIIIGGIWLIRTRTDRFDPRTEPIGGAKLGFIVAAMLAILCQSQGGLALPLAILLLSILLAATRSHRLMQLVALLGIQNAVILAAALMDRPVSPLLAACCAALPLPFAAALFMPPSWSRRAFQLPAAGWIDLALAVSLLAATLTIAWQPLATVFAPLLALDGVFRSLRRLPRTGISLIDRAAGLVKSGLLVAAVCAPPLAGAWLAILATIAVSRFIHLDRHWASGLLAFVGAGLALFGILTAPAILGMVSLFAGFLSIAATVPELAVVLTILLLRLAIESPWPPAIQTIAIAFGTIGLLTCSLLMLRPAHRVTLLELGQCCVAILSVATGHADGRFAALVLLVLVILCRSATRSGTGSVNVVAIAALGGVPPVGVFPGLVLIVGAMAAWNDWLLLPLAAAMLPFLLASVPRRLAPLTLGAGNQAVFWLPLALGLLVGYLQPAGLAQWWQTIAVGS